MLPCESAVHKPAVEAAVGIIILAILAAKPCQTETARLSLNSLKSSNYLRVIHNFPILRKCDKRAGLSASRALQNCLFNLLQIRQCIHTGTVLINPLHTGCFGRCHLRNIAKLAAAFRADKMMRSRLSGINKPKCHAAAVRTRPVNSSRR